MKQGNRFYVRICRQLNELCLAKFASIVVIWLVPQSVANYAIPCTAFNVDLDERVQQSGGKWIHPSGRPLGQCSAYVSPVLLNNLQHNRLQTK